MILTKTVIGFAANIPPNCAKIWRLMVDESAPGLSWHGIPAGNAAEILGGIAGVGGVLFHTPDQAFIFVRSGADEKALERELERVASGKKLEEV
ncbi:MAG: hypothetical protein Q7R90_01480 [bacterium]|nr:hypothetical protein [bacterium]